MRCVNHFDTSQALLYRSDGHLELFRGIRGKVYTRCFGRRRHSALSGAREKISEFLVRKTSRVKMTWKERRYFLLNRVC